MLPQQRRTRLQGSPAAMVLTFDLFYLYIKRRLIHVLMHFVELFVEARTDELYNNHGPSTARVTQWAVGSTAPLLASHCLNITKKEKLISQFSAIPN